MYRWLVCIIMEGAALMIKSWSLINHRHFISLSGRVANSIASRFNRLEGFKSLTHFPNSCTMNHSSDVTVGPPLFSCAAVMLLGTTSHCGSLQSYIPLNFRVVNLRLFLVSPTLLFSTCCCWYTYIQPRLFTIDDRLLLNSANNATVKCVLQHKMSNIIVL